MLHLPKIDMCRTVMTLEILNLPCGIHFILRFQLIKIKKLDVDRLL